VRARRGTSSATWFGALGALVALAFLGGAAFASRADDQVGISRTCSDYTNQRQAQLNKDTRDADGDGIYCEDLPCPCLKPSGGGATGPPSAQPPSNTLPALFKGRCKRGRLPDYHCTPGAVFRHVTAAQVCKAGYSKSVRNVPESRKQAVYRSYGIRRHRPYEYEIDHLVSLELGGSNSQRNLWPEKQPGAKSKDEIENALHQRVCEGILSLHSAETKIRHWIHVQTGSPQVRSFFVPDLTRK
jgi:hypothetical protein